MAEVRPFAALRYIAIDNLGDVLSPPYDVISPSAQESLYDRDPHNIIRLELARGGEDQSAIGRYAQAANTLEEWRHQNVLGRDGAPAIYLYEETFTIGGKTRTRTGFFATVRLHPWEDKVVLAHERTRPKPKVDRLAMLNAVRTQISPLFALFDDLDGTIRLQMARLMAGDPNACADIKHPVGAEMSTGHRLWRVEGEEAEALCARLADGPIYMADGHHRYETALSYRETRIAAGDVLTDDSPANFILMLLAAAEEPALIVLPTHRLITFSVPVDADTLRGAWSRWFDIDAQALPAGPNPGETIAKELVRLGELRPTLAVIGVEPGSVWYLGLERQPSEWHAPETWRTLDVGLLESLIVEDPHMKDPLVAIEFTRGPDEAVSHASDPNRIAIVLNPTTVQQVLATARAGDRMPEKSTYFSPKVATGMVMFPLA